MVGGRLDYDGRDVHRPGGVPDETEHTQVVSGTLGTAVPVRRAGDRHDTDVLSDRPLHLRAYRLRDKRL